jgi:hypothetical protein
VEHHTQIIMSARTEFEDWITQPPLEKDIERWPNDRSSSWPGQYKDIAVELAWLAWQEALSMVDNG